MTNIGWIKERTKQRLQNKPLDGIRTVASTGTWLKKENATLSMWLPQINDMSRSSKDNFCTPVQRILIRVLQEYSPRCLKGYKFYITFTVHPHLVIFSKQFHHILSAQALKQMFVCRPQLSSMACVATPSRDPKKPMFNNFFCTQEICVQIVWFH